MLVGLCALWVGCGSVTSATSDGAASGGAGGGDASSATDTRDATLVQDAAAEEASREAGVEAPPPSYPSCAPGTKQVNWCDGCSLVPAGGGQVMPGIQSRDGYRCNAAIIGNATSTIGTQDKCVFDDATFGAIMAVKNCDDCKGCLLPL